MWASAKVDHQIHTYDTNLHLILALVIYCGRILHRILHNCKFISNASLYCLCSTLPHWYWQQYPLAHPDWKLTLSLTWLLIESYSDCNFYSHLIVRTRGDWNNKNNNDNNNECYNKYFNNDDALMMTNTTTNLPQSHLRQHPLRPPLSLPSFPREYLYWALARESQWTVRLIPINNWSHWKWKPSLRIQCSIFMDAHRPASTVHQQSQPISSDPTSQNSNTPRWNLELEKGHQGAYKKWAQPLGDHNYVAVFCFWPRDGVERGGCDGKVWERYSFGVKST